MKIRQKTMIKGGEIKRIRNTLSLPHLGGGGGGGKVEAYCGGLERTKSRRGMDCPLETFNL